MRTFDVGSTEVLTIPIWGQTESTEQPSSLNVFGHTEEPQHQIHEVVPDTSTLPVFRVKYFLENQHSNKLFKPPPNGRRDPQTIQLGWFVREGNLRSLLESLSKHLFEIVRFCLGARTRSINFLSLKKKNTPLCTLKQAQNVTINREITPTLPSGGQG